MTFELRLTFWAAILADPEAPRLKAAVEQSQWRLSSGATIDWDLLAQQPRSLRDAEKAASHQFSYGFPYVGNISYLIAALSQLWVRNIAELEQPGINPRVTFVPLEQSQGIAARIFLEPSWYIAPSNHPIGALICSSRQSQIQEAFGQYRWPDEIDTIAIAAANEERATL